MASKLSIQIDLQGAEEVQRALGDIGEAGQKAFEDITKAAEDVGGFAQLKPEEVTKRLEDMGTLSVEQIQKIQDAVNKLSFDEATRSIESLGSTAQDALGAAAQAAQKFGASTQDLAKVESIINSLAARSRQSSTSFQDLAKNYDAARNSVVGAGNALAAARQSLIALPTVTRTATTEVRALSSATAGLRDILATLRPVASAAGVQIGALSAVLRSSRAGVLGIGAALTGTLA